MTTCWAGHAACDGRHSLTWKVQDKALQDLTDKCVELGLTKDQTRQIWQIVAGAFNRLGQAKGAS
jgi:hypothetical protein